MHNFVTASYMYIYLYYISLKWSLSGAVLSCAVQYRRPNGWTDRAQNLHKHSLGLCDDHRGVGELECARMCAARAQTRVPHHISSIGGQTVALNGLNMCTNTHWDYAMTIGGSVNSSAHACVLRARKRAYRTTYPAYAAKRLGRSGSKFA
jgi:hypothetical protein